MKRVIKFRAYTEISNEVLGMKYDVPHNYNDTVMQFTGLLDRNGKEIYEGDILKNEVKNCKVEWSEMNLAWVGVGLMAFGMNGDGEYEIIGNIYENPELLK